MTCVEMVGLMARYTEAARILSEAGALLAEASAVGMPDTFGELWEQCEQARLLCVQIRHEIAAHDKEHGCGLFK